MTDRQEVENKKAFPECREGHGRIEFKEESGGHVLEFLQRANLNSSAGRLCLEHLLFTGEGVDTLARLYGGLVNGDDLQQTGKNEFTAGAFLDVAFDNLRKAIDDGSHLLAAEFGFFSDLIEDLGFGVTLLDCGWFLCHA